MKTYERIDNMSAIVTITDNNFPIPIATASASNFDEGRWYLNRCLVSKQNSRGKGLGSQVLSQLKGLLKTNGVKVLIVEPGGYNSDLNDLKRFYEKHGFLSIENHYECVL